MGKHVVQHKHEIAEFFKKNQVDMEAARKLN
jgi:hypothetical protein